MTHHTPQLYVSCALAVVVCKQAVHTIALCPGGGTLKVVALLSALHVNMHHWLFLFYLDTAASSHVLSRSHPGYKKNKKNNTHIYIRRIMCFEKPSDIRIWLVCTNHCSPNLKKAHTHAVHCGLDNTVSLMGVSQLMLGRGEGGLPTVSLSIHTYS